ncbi:putative long-chain-alcohol oxidase [Dioscorea sansibarensis]
MSFPYMLFKGIATYGWPNGCWFLHGLIDKVKYMMGLKASQAMVLNVMGYDSCDGRITFDKETNKIRLTHAHDPLLPRKIQALQSITKKLGGILFMSRYRSTSVHLLGGCNAASDSSNGVCNPKGQVYDVSGHQPAEHAGLYVCDGSLIPCSVGINPILTITTVSEYISKHLVHEVLNSKNRLRQNGVMTTGLVELADSTMHSKKSVINNGRLDIGLQSHHQVQTMKSKGNVTFKETLKGFIGGMPCIAYLEVKMNLAGQDSFSQNNINKGYEHSLLKGKIGGYVVFQVINKEPLYVIDGEIDMLVINDRTPYTQYMHYKLVLASASGSRYLLEGKKVMNPYILATYAWKESKTMHVNFKELTGKDDKQSKVCGDSDQRKVDLKGELHLSVVGLLKSLISMQGNQKGRFVRLLLQSLWRTYILQIPRKAESRFTSFAKYTKTYPTSSLHEVKTGN